VSALDKLRERMDRLGERLKRGRLRPLSPAYDATLAFLFTVPQRTAAAPHVRGPLSVKRYMSVAIVAALPCLAAGVYFFGWRVLAMTVVTYAAGLSVEWLFAMFRREEINEGFFVTGILYPLILPPTLPLWMVAVGIIFGVVIGKELFGGTGRNPFNPALVGRCFLLIAYPTAASAAWLAPPAGWLGRLGSWSADAITTATPLVSAKSGTYASLFSLLAGDVSGSAGETCRVLIILGGLLLLVTGVGSWRTVLSSLGSFAVLLFVLAAAAPAKFAHAGSGAAETVLWHLLAGGLLFGVLFMATDPVTSPFSKAGKWGYGIIIGVSTVLIRHLTGYVEGVMFAILLGNIAAPILDELATRAHLRRIRDEG